MRLIHLVVLSPMGHTVSSPTQRPVTGNSLGQKKSLSSISLILKKPLSFFSTTLGDTVCFINSETSRAPHRKPSKTKVQTVTPSNYSKHDGVAGVRWLVNAG